MAKFRVETDTMGRVKVPAGVHYGAQTQRAAGNFPISGIRFPRRFIRALGLVKTAAARENRRAGLLKGRHAAAIARAAGEVAAGKWDAEFVVDVFQTGSGTSTNMNANEIISSRANEILGGRMGDRSPIRPNDEVNLSQSSNDVIPTAVHLAALDTIDTGLLPALAELTRGLGKKAREFRKVVKTGRTHLQDAVPITLGQEFSGYAAQVERGIARVRAARERLLELPIGGTALGTGLNAPAGFGRRMCAALARATRLKVRPARNAFEAMGARDALVEASGALRTAAVSLSKIAADIRLLACGPRAGIGEISLPELQPGSSIMPGKVNPVMPEVMIQVCAQVVGNDVAVTLGGLAGQLDLNAAMPLMARNLLESGALLAAACRTFNRRCVSGPGRGITADVKRCRELLERTLMPVTALVPRIGHARAAEAAREAHRTGKTVKEVVRELGLVAERDLDRILDLSAMARGKAGKKK